MAPEHEPWWKAAVVYQIHPRSFADSDRDGIGDLPGIASRLDYLAALGVDVLWLSPVSPSPQDDVGYDISDCHAGARTRRSATGTGGARRATGCRPAWELDPATGEYYLHLFSRKQPDLNWESPEVRDALVAGPRGRRLPHGREMHRAVVAGRDEPLLTVGEMPGGAGTPASPSGAGTASPGTTATSRASCRASATTARTACAPRRCSAPSCTCTAGRRTSTRARSSG